MNSTLLWMIYFSTTTFGYIGMKLASTASGQREESLYLLLHPWSIAALVAWTISGFVWPYILTHSSLIWANAFSSLRVILISLAAVVILGENITGKQVFGAILIMSGIIVSK